MIRKLYFGGQFQFMYKDYSFANISNDFRSLILKDANKFLVKPIEGYYALSNNVHYIGPFYFYDNNQKNPPQDKVVSTENDAVNNATDCIFVLSNGSAPGTITELIHATLLNKNVIVFYETNNDSGLIKNDLWYALLYAQKYNVNCKLIECKTYNDAINNCLTYINNLIAND